MIYGFISVVFCTKDTFEFSRHPAMIVLFLLRCRTYILYTAVKTRSQWVKCDRSHKFPETDLGSAQFVTSFYLLLLSLNPGLFLCVTSSSTVYKICKTSFPPVCVTHKETGSDLHAASLLHPWNQTYSGVESAEKRGAAQHNVELVYELFFF